MKPTYVFAVLIFLHSYRLLGQDSIKTNPIIYADLSFSALTSVRNSLLFAGSFSYQTDNNLFSVKATGIGHTDIVYLNAGPNVNYNYGEAGLLYGRRWITGGHSFSLSAGLAVEGQAITTSYRGSPMTETHTHYIGLPFEAEVLWFKARKRRCRAYYVFPYGKPTGFGSSMGLNIAGNLSAHSFISFGLVFGLGYFKRY